jgi:hypothetical protein
MSRNYSRKCRRPKPKAVLRLPDLDQAKSAIGHAKEITLGQLAVWRNPEDKKNSFRVADHLRTGLVCGSRVCLLPRLNPPHHRDLPI